MIITKVERQKKNRSRFSVFIDDAYAFSVSEDVCARFILHQGQTVSPAERRGIENAELESSVKRTALRFRSYRPRSTKEMRDYLVKKGFTEQHIAKALTYLQENKLLDDIEFARMLCRDRLMLKPVGKRVMKQLLVKKGIDNSTIDILTNEFFTSEKESDSAFKEGERKYKRIASLPPLAKKKKIYEHLLRRGYDSSLSITIANQLVKT